MKNTNLNNNQAALYIAALELGEATMTELAKKAGFKRATAYALVEELEIDGLISQVQKGKRKIYSAVHPRRLLQIANFKQKKIEDALPELSAIFNAPKNKPKIQVFEGSKGVSYLYRELYQSLSNKEEALWFANIEALRKYIPEGITEYKKLLRKLQNPKIRELNYGDNEGKKWSQETKKLRGKNHINRVLPTDYEYGQTDNLIFGNKLVIFSLKEDIFVIIIESEEIVKTFKVFFEWAWKHGKEI